jgi:hypothetical protein
MAFTSSESMGDMQANAALTESRRSEILSSLVSLTQNLVSAQHDAFSARLADALIRQSETSTGSREANVSFHSSNILKSNSYAFHHLASAALAENLQRELVLLECGSHGAVKADGALSLVSFEEMDSKLQIGAGSRPFEQQHADAYNALNIRLANLLQRDELPLSQNPFRPEVFLRAINQAWCGFDPDPESHQLVMPLLRPDVFLELSTLLQALNDALIANGILPDLQDSYRIKKTDGHSDPARKDDGAETALLQKLKRMFSAPDAAADIAVSVSADGYEHRFESGQRLGNMLRVDSLGQAGQVSGATRQLYAFLNDLQQRIVAHDGLGGDASGASTALPHDARLAQIKRQFPPHALTQVDENTIDLLTKVFDTVFRDHNIPSEIKDLIGLLQIPILKAALIDKEFFFEEAHPARRLIELLSKSSMAWDRKKGYEDPLYQAMKRNIGRVQQEFDREISLFSIVVSNLECFLVEQEAQDAAGVLSKPITEALQLEKLTQARTAAKSEVAQRIGTGELLPFVETFLVAKWVPVLSLAYSVKEEKPKALQSALQTMDQLIWSVKPKLTPEQRRELITKLPGLLTMVNKWLNVIQWEDADRLRFFSELAECHASIVRAPLELSPQRRLEIAVEAAQKATERRLEKRGQTQQQMLVRDDQFVATVASLERGAWLEFTPTGEPSKRVKLAWVSPQRSLFIFTTSAREEAFSMSTQQLEQLLRDGRARRVLLDGLVGRALSEAFEENAA